MAEKNWHYEVDERGAVHAAFSDGEQFMLSPAERSYQLLEALREAEDRLPKPLSDEFFDRNGVLVAEIRRDREVPYLNIVTYTTAGRDHEFIDWLNAQRDAGKFGERERPDHPLRVPRDRAYGPIRLADHGRIIAIEVNERNAVIEDADMMREIGEFFLKAAADRERGS